jgi:hypothetical protein
LSGGDGARRRSERLVAARREPGAGVSAIAREAGGFIRASYAGGGGNFAWSCARFAAYVFAGVVARDRGGVTGAGFVYKMTGD